LNKKQCQKIARIVLPTGLAIVITYLLLKEIDVHQIPKTLSRLSVKALCIGFGCYCLLVWTKTLRFRALLGLDCRVHQIFPILALHTFWGNFLPMRTGDVSYVYLMQRRQQVDATQGIASLLVASLIDLVLLIGLMVVTASRLSPKLSGQFSWTILYLMPLLIGAGLITVTVFACIAPQVCNALAHRCAAPLLRLGASSRLPSALSTSLTWIVKKGITVIHEFTVFARFKFVRAEPCLLTKTPAGKKQYKSMQKNERRGRHTWWFDTVAQLNSRFLKVWVYSLICLAIRFGFQCYLVTEMGVDVPMTEVLFALAFTSVFNLLPIQTVGNFGTTEFPFAWLLNHFGTSIETATVTGFSLHLLILLYCLPLGAYGLLKKHKTPSRLG